MKNKALFRRAATSPRAGRAMFAPAPPDLTVLPALRPDTPSTTWTAGSGNFNTAANWSNGVPALGVDAYIEGTSTAPLTVTYSSGSDTANSLTTAYTTLDLSAGTLTLQNGSNLSSAAAALSQSGGKIDFQNGESLNSSSTIAASGSAVQQTAGIIQVDQGALDIEGNSTFGGTIAGLSGGGTLVLDYQDSGATYTFTGTADLTIGALILDGGSTTIDSGATIKAGKIDVSNNATLSFGANTTYAGEYSVASQNSNAFLYLDGHTLSLTGSVALQSSSFTVCVEGPGTLAVSGATTIGGVGGGGVVFGATAALVNTGNVTQNYAVQIGDGSGAVARVTNSAAGTWSLTSSAAINTGSNASSAFANAGLFENIGTNATPTIYASFTNTGTISAAANDTIYFANSLTNTGTITGGGQVAISGGIASFGSGTVLSVAQFGLYNSAALSLGVSLTYAGAFDEVANNGNSVLNLDGHVLTLKGNVELESGSYTATVVGAGTLALSGTSTIGGTGGYGFELESTALLSNSGVVTQNDTVQIGDSSGAIAAITNGKAGTWKLTSNAGINTGSNASSSFANAGLFENIGTNATPTIYASFTNSGRINVAASDTVYFDNSLTNSGSITGGGQVAISGGVATLGSGTVLGTAQFGVYNNAVLSLGTSLSYAGVFDDISNAGVTMLNLDGNTLSLSGTVELESGSYTVAVVGAGTLALSGASTIGGTGGFGFELESTALLSNSGTVTQNDTVQIGDSSGAIAAITNTATGTWDLTASNLISTGSNAASSFTNAGLLENVGNNAAPVIDAVFNNTGTLDAVAASTSITLEDGGSLAGTLAGAGAIYLAGGTFTLAKATVLSVASLGFEGDAFVSLGTATTVSGTFTLSAGATADLAASADELLLNGPSALSGTLTGDGYALASKASVTSVDGLTLAGAVYFEAETGATVTEGSQVTVGTASSSKAQLKVAAGAAYHITSDAGISGTGSLINSGVFEKYAGTNTSVIGVLTFNAVGGTLEAASGTLDFAANVTNNGTAAAAAAHTIEFGASLSSSAGDTGTISLSDGGLAQFGGYVGSSQTLSFLDTSISAATIASPAEFAATIKGFGGSNALFLSGLASVTGSYSGTTSTGTLTLTELVNDDTVTVAKLHFAGDYTLANFTFTDNPGGVLIDYAKSAAAGTTDAPIGASSAMLPHALLHVS